MKNTFSAIREALLNAQSQFGSVTNEEIEIYQEGIEFAITNNKVASFIGSKGDLADLVLFLPYGHEGISILQQVDFLSSMGLMATQSTVLNIDLEDGKKIVLYKLIICFLGAGIGRFDSKNVSNIAKMLADVLNGDVPINQINRLVISLGLSVREINTLMACCLYAEQLGWEEFTNGAATIGLSENPEVAAFFIELIKGAFDPSGTRHKKTESNLEAFDVSISTVQNEDSIKIFRLLFALINAILRVNIFCPKRIDNNSQLVCIKIKTSLLPRVPQPIPLVEIFMYDGSFVGCHLRGGKVARGGIRWSSMGVAMRAEILGLFKTQMVKNAVIVPSGAKGGFYIFKNNPTKEHVIDCYKRFISGLLDVTDNIINGKVVAPEGVIALDGEDPYLVVAADKGTSSFSDYANEVSKQYGFWLGDAFASGGSNGYNHKTLGITARGAWESVKRHLREMGINPEREEITAVAIGSMTGDVAGNGLIYSNKIKLLGAFGHSEIFVDPNPDAQLSYEERVDMFNKNKEWKEYGKLSNGGAVFERNAKSVLLSLEVKKLLGLDEGVNEISPDELIRSLLKLKVTLLWSGGVGTYIKSEGESRADIFDNTNENVRINGNELGAKCVGEGANLSITQKGRIEYSLAGGRCFTDALDNSGGVDCSDREVNIKIAIQRSSLSPLLKEDLIKKCEREVVQLILRNNLLQGQIVSSMFFMNAHDLVVCLKHFVNHLEQEGLLNRELESIPSNEEIDFRIAKNKAFTRPELAVLLGYAKLFIKNTMSSMKEEIFKEEFFSSRILSYFPKELVRALGEEAVLSHRLAKQIAITVFAGEICNFNGITFFYDLMSIVSKSAEEVTVAYSLLEPCEVQSLLIDISCLENDVPPHWQYKQLNRITHVVKIVMVILLTSLQNIGLEAVRLVMLYVGRALKDTKQMVNIFGNEMTEEMKHCYNELVPVEISNKIAGIMMLPRLITFALASFSSKGSLCNKDKEREQVIIKMLKTASKIQIPSLRQFLYGASFRDYDHMKNCFVAFSKVSINEIMLYSKIEGLMHGEIERFSIPIEVTMGLREDGKILDSLIILAKSISSIDQAITK